MPRTKKSFVLETYLAAEQERINKALKRYIYSLSPQPKELYYAISYSVLNGGKRIRPILAISSFRWAGGKGKKIIPVACALELIHAFSLVHDDLPSIDNDDFRRHKLTCHKELERITGDKRLGEGIALLAGDAILSLAFRLITKSNDIRVINEVANSALNLVVGEASDVLSEGKAINEDELKFIHLNKTASLIRTSCKVGAMMAKANRRLINAITRYGTYIGLAFQIRDDLLGEIGTEEELGKPVGSDKRLKKATYPRIVGLEKTAKLGLEYVEKAKSFLPKNRNNTVLFALADYIATRMK